MMTPRENLLSVFRHESPEWIPVVGHIDPYNQPNRDGMESELASKLGDVTWDDGSTRIFSEYLRLDVMDYFGELRHVNPSVAPVAIKRRKVTVERNTQGDIWTTTYKTPRGELREAYKKVRKDGTFQCIEHIVKNKDDLPILAFIVEDEEHVLNDGAADFVAQRKAMVGDSGLSRCYMPGTPLGMMVRLYAGVETTAYLWADYRKELRELFTCMEENHLRQFRLYSSLGYDILYGTDDTSTTTISPAMFEEFCMGYTDRVAKAVHEYGVLYAHHSCGLIHHLLNLYRQTNMDAVDALYIEPLGDIPSVARAKELLGPKITILCALHQMCYPIDDRNTVAESIETMFRDSDPGDNIIFCLASYPHLNMEQTAFVAQECRKHQQMYAQCTQIDD